MSNSFFRFKQFTVHQEHCAMKVSTDACIQGAWTPLPDGNIRVLDVGAGTGLLSLMIAQRQPGADIDAIEIDAEATAQAKQNVARSPFAERIRIYHADARSLKGSRQYDLIICNPPFFKNSLKGPYSTRNAARHDVHLQHQHLLELFEKHLAAEGRISVMWPVPEMEQWTMLAEAAGWKRCNDLEVKDRNGAGTHRRISIFSRVSEFHDSSVLVIKNTDGSYTENFSRLLAPFYLNI